MNINEINRKKVIVRWKKVHQKTIDFINKNKNKKYLKARICGYLSGDGNILVSNNKTCTHNTVRFFPDDAGMVNSFVKAIKEFYGKEPNVKESNNYYSITLDSKPIVEDLVLCSNYGKLDWKIPGFINDNKMKIEFIRAYFDCEAYVSNKQIVVKSVNSSGLKEIKEILGEFHVESKIYRYKPKNLNWNEVFILVISKSESRLRYLEKIGFNHTAKLKKLQEAFNLTPRSRNLVSHKS